MREMNYEKMFQNWEDTDWKSYITEKVKYVSVDPAKAKREEREKKIKRIFNEDKILH